jgi:hypothetical protein
MIRFSSPMVSPMVSPIALATLALGAISLPAMAGSAPGMSAPAAYQLAQFSPADRDPPITADGGGARFLFDPDRSAPEGTGSTPTRNSCVAMSPLVPKDANGSYYGLTASDRPELHLYALRAEGSRAKQATLYIYEYSADTPAIEPVYEQSFTLPDATRSIVSVGVDPNSDFTLDPSTQYEWYIEIQCDPDSADPTTLAFTYGWIERTASDPIGLATAGTNDAAAAYGEAGIWFEYLDNLIAAGSENWGYILDGFSSAINDSADLSEAVVLQSPDDAHVQIIQIQP